MLDIKKLLTKMLTWMSGTKRVTWSTIFENHAFKATSTSWQYIGKSFTIPNGEAWLVFMTCGFNSGRPIGGGFNSSTTLQTALGIPDRGYFEDSNGVTRTPMLYLSTGTYYCFCKRASTPANNNNHSVYAIKIFV